MRSAVIDLPSQPIRNELLDPRCTKWGFTAPVGPGPSNERWTAYTTYTLVTGATDGPPNLGIATYARATFTDATKAGLGIHLADNTEAANSTNVARLIPVTAGQQVTVVVHVRSSVNSAALQFQLKNRFATGAVWLNTAQSPIYQLVAGVWQRLVLTLTPPAGATGLSVSAQFINAVGVAGATLDVTAMQVVYGPDPGVHLDGGSPGWRWLGTAGASMSAGYPLGQVVNLAPFPYPQTTVTGTAAWNNTRWFGPLLNGVQPAGTYAVVTTGLPLGIPRGMRKTWTTGIDTGPGSSTGSNSDTGFDVAIISGSGNTPQRSWPVVPGEVYTISAFMRTSATNKRANIAFYPFDSSGTTLTRQASTPVTLVPNVWTRVSGTFTVPAGCAFARFLPDSPSVATTTADLWKAGDWLEACGYMITRGATLYPYCDGNAPGWSWAATAGASLSAGPAAATLADLGVGAPAATAVGPNTTATIATPGPNAAGRSLYLVTDIVAGYNPWTATAAFGTTGVSGIMIDASDTGSLRIRGDFPGGNTNWWTAIAGAATAGRHVVCGSVDPGQGTVRIIADALAESSRALTTIGTPVYDRVKTTSTIGITPVLAIGFEAGHDLATRQKVLAWLARMYGGGAIPAGY
jgi:hypothetical protein